MFNIAKKNLIWSFLSWCQIQLVKVLLEIFLTSISPWKVYRRFGFAELLPPPPRTAVTLDSCHTGQLILDLQSYCHPPENMSPQVLLGYPYSSYAWLILAWNCWWWRFKFDDWCRAKDRWMIAMTKVSLAIARALKLIWWSPGWKLVSWPPGLKKAWWSPWLKLAWWLPGL